MKTRALPNVRHLQIAAGLSLAFRPKLSLYKTLEHRFDACIDRLVEGLVRGFKKAGI